MTKQHLKKLIYAYNMDNLKQKWILLISCYNILLILLNFLLY